MIEEELFLAAINLAGPPERTAYLDKACGGDVELRRRVEDLVAAHFQPGEFLDEPVGGKLDAAPPTPAATVLGKPGPDPVAGGQPGPAPDDLHFLQPPTRPDSLGRIGHYEVLQILGRGAFGIVFRAFDDVLHRVVAVKVLAPAIAVTSPARKRFLREARSGAAVRHENVMQVYEVGEQPLPYLVMEFIPGETLQQRLDRTGPLEAVEIVRLGRQIAEGLAAAHAIGLIHRDVKPANVLIEGANHRVKITDFGLARAADDASLTQSGVLAGTPMFMAPEQARGEALDHRADLFSLGSVMYVMASGRPPFRAATAYAVLKRVVEETPRPIREVIPEAPPWLCDVIAKLHAKKREDRFQSAREAADVLAACAARLDANAESRSLSPIPSAKPAPRPSGRRKWGAAVVLLLLITLAVTELTGLTRLFRGQQPTPDPVERGAALASNTEASPEAPTPPGVPTRPAAKPLESVGKPGRVEPAGGNNPVKRDPPPPAFTNSIGMEFVLVPKGRSWLGGGKGKLGNKEVIIPADFYLGRYEVTQEEWLKVMERNPSNFSRKGNAKKQVEDVSDDDLKRFPVESVSWQDCHSFVARLNRREAKAGWAYRLPHEAEWEYACRGGPMADRQESVFDFYLASPTNTLLPEQACHGKASPFRTRKVGSYDPNRLGLYDMHGNVWEWCDGGPSDGVRRGGGLHDFPFTCTASYRVPSQRPFRNGNLGFRVARAQIGAPPPETKKVP